MRLQKIFLASPQLKLLQFYLLHRRRDQEAEMERAFLLLTPRPCKAAVPFSKGERKHCSILPLSKQSYWGAQLLQHQSHGAAVVRAGAELLCFMSWGHVCLFPSSSIPESPFISTSFCCTSFFSSTASGAFLVVGWVFVCLLSSLLAFSSPGVFECEAAGLILRHILIYF